jgi:DNA-binding response OmpR family regulator
MFGLFKSKKQKGNGQKILIIDDEPDYVSTVQYHLKWSGYDVVTAVNGKEGLEKTIIEKPDLILLDTSMPVMNGWEVLERLRKHPDVGETPVIMVTARCEVPDIEMASSFGISDYVAKPFDFAKLKEKIELAIEGKKSLSAR